MEWQDQGIMVSVRPHGESSAVVHILSEQHGRCAGYVRGGLSKSNRPLMQLGNHVNVQWRARTNDQLGSFTVEMIKPYASKALSYPDRLQALRSACTIIEKTLPERNVYTNIFNGLQAFLENISSDIWAQAYIVWEINLLRALGFGLHLDHCAVDQQCEGTLKFVSPRTGRGVCEHHATPYKERLIALPAFLSGQESQNIQEDIYTGLRLTGIFFEKFIFHPIEKTLPDARKNLEELFYPEEISAKNSDAETLAS